jgi:hypothetical protein
LSKPIAVVSSDTHGAPMAWAKHPSLRGDSYFSMRQLTDYCLEKKLPLILAGDVFDKTHPDPATVEFFVSCLSAMRWRGLGVYFIQGQHEFSHDTPWLSLVPGALHADGRWFFLPSGHDRPHVKFYGLDFTHAADLGRKLDGIPADADVLIAHQVWAEHMGKFGSPEGSLKDVPHVKMVVTGDYHAHKVTRLKAGDGRDLVVASPGSTCMQEISEDSAKYFFVLHDDLRLTSHALSTRPCYRYRAASVGELDEVVREISEVTPDSGVLPEEIARPIVQVRYLDSLPEAEARLKVACDGRCHFFPSPFGGSRQQEGETERVYDGPLGMEHYLDEVRGADPAAYATATRLWRSRDVKAEARAVVEEALQGSEDLETRGLWSSTKGP